jgi:predicted SAM-dependent methyltransferase
VPVRLVVGAGRTDYEGWISTNIDSLNLLDRGDWASLVGEVRLDRVLAEHVWEHLSPSDGITALRNVADHLKPGGRVRIAVPDGRHPDDDYLAHVKPGGIGPGADDHKILYTVEILEAAMREAGLVPERLEHWDAAGEFHAKDWDPVDGKVVRSLRYDSRNAEGVLKYTSLIIDGVKPST